MMWVRAVVGIVSLVSAISIVVAEPTFKGAHPIARIKESVVCCPMDTVSFDGWASIVAGAEISQWIWHFSFGLPDTVCTSGELRMAAPTESRSYVVTLRVRDSKGRISEADSATFHVMSALPSIQMGRDTTVRVGSRINFSPEIKSNCGKPVKFEWDFNDDGKADFRSSENANASRIYQKAGRYYARLKVTDDLGRETGGIRIVTVH